MSENPYEQPGSELEGEASDPLSDPLKVYSPMQSAVGAFLGGPVAIILFVGMNFKALDEAEQYRNVLWGTLGGTVLLYLLVLMLPSSSGMSLSGGLAVLAYLMVKQNQFSKEDILESEDYEFQSGWRVFGVSLLALILSMAILSALTGLVMLSGMVGD